MVNTEIIENIKNLLVDYNSIYPNIGVSYLHHYLEDGLNYSEEDAEKIRNSISEFLDKYFTNNKENGFVIISEYVKQFFNCDDDEAKKIVNLLNCSHLF